MKKVSVLVAFLFSMLTVSLAWAQEVVEAVNPDKDFIQLFLQSIGGIEGAGTLTLVVIVGKLILKFLDSSYCNRVFRKLTPEGKLTTAMVVTFVLGVVGLMLPPTSLTLGASLIHSSNISLLTVAFNQIYKKLIAKKQV